MNREYTRAPHRYGPENGSPNAALLIDFDNVTMGIRSNLGQELRTLLDSDMIRGKVAVQRAYADWRRYPQYIVPLSEASIDLIFAPAYGSSKKNATDIRLAIDACELVFTRPEIGTYILLSGDSDFSSLVLKLKEYGKYVIGVGLLESSSDILVQNCDEYYSYTSLSGLTSAAEMTSQKLGPWELTERALDRMVQRSDVMRSDRLKQVMLEIDPNFDEKSAGYSKFNRFLAEAAHRGIVSLRKSGDGQYEVSPSGRASASDEKPRPSAREESRGGRSSGRRDGGRRGRGRRGDGGRAEAEARAARPEPPAKEAAPAEETAGEPAGVAAEPAGASPSALRRAYDLLRGAVSSLTPDEQGRVRDSEVKRKILSEDGGFDETTLGFRKFSRFLQQAHDEGVIDLSQGEDGNYYLSPAGEEGGAPATASAAGGGRRERRAEPEPTSRQRSPEPADEETEVDPAEVAAASAASAAADRRGGRTARRGGEDVGAKAETEAEEKAAEPERPAARRSRPRGMGRFRRGSRGRPEGGAAGGEAAPDIGPVDREPEAGGEGEAATAAAGAGPSEEEPSARAASPTSAPEAKEAEEAPKETSGGRRGRSGLGRFRRGSRGGSRGDGAPGARGSEDGSGNGSGRSGAEGGRSAESGGAASSRPDDPARDQAIEHMIRNYPGVGRKTAERLVDEFGNDVFEVMDSSPGRVSELLTEHRARAVLDAREAERRSG